LEYSNFASIFFIKIDKSLWVSIVRVLLKNCLL
jgi:hypothetical protein